MAHLHAHGIEHRDLKPDNILVRVRQPLDLVLIDFGIASVIESSVHFTSGSRTIRYAPPEAFSGVVHKGTDYWSLGVILVEVLTGRHPFEGLSDQIAMSQLATRPIDELAAGVSDPLWRLLCRGLLRRDPKNRWGKAEIDRWLRGDTSLTVVEESAAAGQLAVAYRPYPRFGGPATPAALAVELARHWDEARKDLAHGYIKDWVTKDVRDYELASALEDIDLEQALDLDGRLFKTILRCDPSLQPIFVDLAFDIDALRQWAIGASQGEPNARAHLASIYNGRLLIFTSEVTGNPTFLTIDQQWRAALEEYEVLRQQLARTNPRLQINAVDDSIRARLLLASLPDGNHLRILRQTAIQLVSADARECSWFRNLGEPSTASAAALLLMPDLVHEAEAETREIRQREQERRVAELKRFISRTARVGGWGLVLILIAVLASSIWNWLSRSTAQRASRASTGPEYISPLPQTTFHRPDELMEYLKRGGYQLSNTGVRFRPQATWLSVSWPAEISKAYAILPISFDANVFVADCRTSQPANVNSWQVLNAGWLDLRCNPFQARADNGGWLYFYYRSGAASAPPQQSTGVLPLVPLKFCEEYVRDGDPKGCFDASRGARHTRKWYIRPETTASLPWFPERTASIVYMRAFGNDHTFLEGCGARVDVNINVRTTVSH